MKKTLFIITIVILIILIFWAFAFKILITDKETIAIVNNEIITEKDLKLLEEEYPEFERKELIIELIIEKLTLEKAEKLGIIVTEEQVEEKLEQISQMGDIINNKIIEKYKSLDNYAKPLKNRLIYEMLKENEKENFKSFTDFNNNSIIIDSEEYIKQQNYTNISETDKNAIINQFKDNYYDSLFNVYFEIWKYKLINDARVEIFEDISGPIERDIYDIEESEIPYFFKSYFNSSLFEQYEIISLRTAQMKNYYDKFLYIKMKDSKSNKIIEIELDLNREYEENLNSNNEIININGINGILEESDNSVKIHLFDTYLNANIYVTTDNLEKDEIINFLKDFIRVSYKK